MRLGIACTILLTVTLIAPVLTRNLNLDLSSLSVQFGSLKLHRTTMKTVKKDANSLAYRRRHHKGEHHCHQQPKIIPWRQVSKMKPINLHDMKSLLVAISSRLTKIQKQAKLHENFNYRRFSESVAYLIFAERGQQKFSIDDYIHKVNDLLVDILLGQARYKAQFGLGLWAVIKKQIWSLLYRARAITAKLSKIYRQCFPEYKSIRYTQPQRKSQAKV